MKRFEPNQTAPLALADDGTIRIANSRVTLDSIVHEFKEGASAEQIQEDFPSLSLREIYGATSYYLDHTDDVEQYLQEQETTEKQTRQEIEAASDSSKVRKRVRDRLAK
jgi:uncharacterized protein (DUF433 family)